MRVRIGICAVFLLTSSAVIGAQPISGDLFIDTGDPLGVLVALDEDGDGLTDRAWVLQSPAARPPGWHGLFERMTVERIETRRGGATLVIGGRLRFTTGEATPGEVAVDGIIDFPEIGRRSEGELDRLPAELAELVRPDWRRFPIEAVSTPLIYGGLQPGGPIERWGGDGPRANAFGLAECNMVMGWNPTAGGYDSSECGITCSQGVSCNVSCRCPKFACCGCLFAFFADCHCQSDPLSDDSDCLPY